MRRLLTTKNNFYLIKNWLFCKGLFMKLELPSVCFAKWDDLESRSYSCTLVNLLLVPSSLHLISLSAKFLLFERTFLFEVLKKFWGGYHSRCFCRYILSFTLQAQSKSDCKWNQVWGSLVSWATDKRVCRVHDKHNSRHRMQSAKLSLFSNVFSSCSSSSSSSLSSFFRGYCLDCHCALNLEICPQK